jgi:MinD superfamily P-loop ATPase
MVTSVRGADVVVLVTEPTPFGLHDLKLAVATVCALGIPFGVVINQADAGDGRTAAYCRDEGVPVLLEIPHDRRVAEAYSRGDIPAAVIPELRALLGELSAKAIALAGADSGGHA